MIDAQEDRLRQERWVRKLGNNMQHAVETDEGGVARAYCGLRIPHMWLRETGGLFRCAKCVRRVLREKGLKG